MKQLQDKVIPNVNIGGISQPFVEWEEGRRYTDDKFVRYGVKFYRVTEAHVSTQTFDATKFVELDALPTRRSNCKVSKTFPTKITEVPTELYMKQ